MNGFLGNEYASKFEGRLLEIIPEERFKKKPDSGLLEGYTENYLKVTIPRDNSLIGKIVKVKISKAGYPSNEGQRVRVMDESALT